MCSFNKAHRKNKFFCLVLAFLRSRQFFEQSLFLSISLRSRQLVDQSLLFSLSLRSTELVDQSPFLAARFARCNWSTRLSTSPLASLETIGWPVSLFRRSLHSRQFLDQSPFLASRCARCNWSTGLFILTSRFARGHCWRCLSIIASRFARAKWLEIKSSILVYNLSRFENLLILIPNTPQWTAHLQNKKSLFGPLSFNLSYLKQWLVNHLTR